VGGDKKIMGKAPAFQFYVRDWLSDPQLRLASPSTRGIWIDLLCFMWEAPERGKITTTKEKLGRMVGAENGDLEQFFDDVEELSFCDIVTHDNNKITLCNRRMSRDEKNKINNKLRQQRYRERHNSNKKITPPSSSSSSTSKKIESIPYHQIVDYMNQKTASNFKPNSKATKTCIKARINEGFTVEDFKAVIDHKTEQWATDEKMVEYLRPSTLFSSKFESYLNAARKTSKPTTAPPEEFRGGYND
jgi:uncharacterized phage protein (TIGR02220 family)